MMPLKAKSAVRGFFYAAFQRLRAVTQAFRPFNVPGYKKVQEKLYL